MKKIMMLFLVLIFLFSTKNVFAQDQYHLTLEKQNGIYMSRRGVNYDDDSYPFYIYKMDGMFAYCIEPGKHITTYTYTGVSDYVDLGFSEELKEKLELIGYYGREYPGHDNVRYSMAAQALIWELTGVDSVTFWTKQYEQGEEIDISKERNEILSLVNNHKTLPNFKTNYYGYLKREMTIYDTNKVLDNYEIEYDGEQEMYIKDNTLHIMPRKAGMMNIYFKRKSYDEYNTIIFVGKSDSSSQKLGRLHFNKDIRAEFTLSIDGIALIIHKVDENNNLIKKPEIKFKIKDLTRGEYIDGIFSDKTFTTNDGMFGTVPLPYGEYEIEEVENQIIPGYTWNSEKVKVILDDNTEMKWDDETYNYIDVYFKNNSVKASLEINKKGEKAIFDNNTITYQEIDLSNIVFDLYTYDNKFIKTITTDSKGYAKVSELKVGKYYLIEKTKLNNYLEKDKINFEIKQDNQYQTSINYKLNIKNELKKGGIEFFKEELHTNRGIPDTIMEIYNENNELLLTKKTDKDGKIIVNNLPIGKYYFKEKEANYYFKITDEKVPFEIKNNGEVAKAKLINEKIVGTLEINKKGENYHFINNNVVYENEPLHAIEFEIFDNTNNLIGTIKTNENGYAKYKPLPLGKYYLVEKTCLNKYICNDKIYFEIKKGVDNKAIDVKLIIENKLKKGNLEFTKTDFVTSEGIPNTIIEIYNDKDILLFTKETDNSGRVVINNLPYGKYYIIEKTPNYLYEKTNEKVMFEIKENCEIVKAKMTNKKLLGNLEIEKIGEKYKILDEKMVYEKIQLSNIEFDLYNDYGKFIATIKTDDNGYSKYEGLTLGKYYLIEKAKLDNYILNKDKIYFEIKKDDNRVIPVKLTINNYLKKGSLLFSKKDLVTGEGIPNTIIEIYDENNNLWFTKKTDEEGNVIINDLPIGKYKIIEKEANSLYMLTNEQVFFEIKENSEVVKAVMTNKKIEVPVPKTGTSEGIVANIFFGISLLLGLGKMYYERKKAY